MSSASHTVSDRLISVLVSLIFSVPTSLLLWFGISKQIALFGDGDTLSLDVLVGLIAGFGIVAFIFPSRFPSMLGSVWTGILKVQKWWGW